MHLFIKLFGYFIAKIYECPLSYIQRLCCPKLGCMRHICNFLRSYPGVETIMEFNVNADISVTQGLWLFSDVTKLSKFYAVNWHRAWCDYTFSTTSTQATDVITQSQLNVFPKVSQGFCAILSNKREHWFQQSTFVSKFERYSIIMHTHMHHHWSWRRIGAGKSGVYVMEFQVWDSMGLIHNMVFCS